MEDCHAVVDSSCLLPVTGDRGPGDVELTERIAFSVSLYVAAVTWTI